MWEIEHKHREATALALTKSVEHRASHDTILNLGLLLCKMNGVC